MKKFLFYAFTTLLIFSSCGNNLSEPEKASVKEEVRAAEQAFNNLVESKGIEIGFYEFAAENADIKRGNDSIISGKEGIKNFYSKPVYKNAKVSWSPDFIDVSDDGTLAYTYGKYEWQVTDSAGTVSISKGVFHTVWKKQADGSWKYVWD